MYFKQTLFAGIMPGITPRQLPDNYGQLCENADLENGNIVALRYYSSAHNLTYSTYNSIYPYVNNGTTYWMSWGQSGVKVARGPIPGDTLNRLYYSGDTYPRITMNTVGIANTPGYPSSSYRLGVPAPASTPSVTVTGDVDDSLTVHDVSYVFTLVTTDNREGPPSAPSTIVEMRNGQTATVSISASVYSSSHNLGLGSLKRIYRSNTGSVNTQFQFVGEVPIAQQSYTDTRDAANLGEVLPSGTWVGPPDDDSTLYPDGQLQGLIPLAQGVMAGFTGKRFCLSEPFLPHAWPVQYRITLQDDIVAIASTGNGVVALTNGQPFFITGTDPSSMTAIRVDLSQACINEHSVVDMGDYVLYASPDGLCAVQSATGSVVTKGLISKDQWTNNFDPTTLKAFKYKGTYVAFSSSGGWVYDPNASSGRALSTITVGAVKCGYEDPSDGNLYYLVGSQIRKYRGGFSPYQAKFKSKKFVTPAPTSMSWIGLKGINYPVKVKVWADGVLIADYSLSGSSSGGTPSTFTQITTVPSGIPNATLREPIARLPAAIGSEWEVQVEGTEVVEFCLAQSMDEIRQT